MKGTNKVNYLNREGLVHHNTPVADWSFVYEQSTVRDPKWNLGDEVKVPGGRKFVYSKSAAACLSGQGCETTKIGLYGAVASVAGAVGDQSIVVAAGTHDAVTADELRGGYVIIHTAGNTQMFRGIIGNAASVANAALTLYLDGSLTAVVAVTILVEVFQNPYGSLRTGATVDLAKLGVPAVYVSAANVYFWCQTEGYCFVAPQAGLTGKEIGACWKHDGSIDTLTNGVSVSAIVSSQYAGHRVMGSADLVGPLFYLQG